MKPNQFSVDINPYLRNPKPSTTMSLQSVYPLVYVAIIWQVLYQFNFIVHWFKSHFLNPKVILFHFWCKISPMENGTRKYEIIAQ